MSEESFVDFLLSTFLSDDEGDTGAEEGKRGRVVDVRILSEDDEETSDGDDEQQGTFQKWYVIELVPVSNRYAWILVRR